MGKGIIYDPAKESVKPVYDAIHKGVSKGAHAIDHRLFHREERAIEKAQKAVNVAEKARKDAEDVVTSIQRRIAKYADVFKN